MNNDLISRSALKKALKSNCDVCNDKNTNWCENCCPHNDFEDLIDIAPAVEPEKAKESEIIKTYTKGFDTGVETVKNERPQGEWIWLGDNPNPEHKWSCNKCGRGVKEQENFCPNCGADMRKGGEE